MTVISLFRPIFQAWPIYTLCLSSALLIGAWVFQYGLGYPPCQMCYWQRHAHKAVIGISLAALAAPRFGLHAPRLFLGLIALALFISFGLAFWHVGVEYRWWAGPQTCSAGGALRDMKPEDLLAALDKPIQPPSCDAALWHFLGLSMAAWNALISLAGACASCVMIKRTPHADTVSPT